MIARWLYHLVMPEERPQAGEPLHPASLEREGFVHCSYRDAVLESARLYFAGKRPSALRIDPRLLGGARLEDAPTPRGPMPHVHGPVPAGAIVETLSLEEIPGAPDHIE